MTVISTLITSSCTVHASDSMIAIPRPDGTFEPKEWQRSKIVKVEKWRGAMSYWGLAEHQDQGWITVDWLQEQAYSAHFYTSAEEFAAAVTDKLRVEIGRMGFPKSPTSAGIGIHLSVYEYIDGYYIPELFLISNWADTSYSSLRPNGVELSRETYHTAFREPPAPEHREPQYRVAVKRHLDQRGQMLFYNNGDPQLFNRAAAGILSTFQELGRRNVLREPDAIKTWIGLARRPVEVVANAQLDFCKERHRLVGGRIHDLAILAATGQYASTSDG